MERVSLTSSAEVPVNSPVLKMREFEFQVAAMHRENDELRMQLDQKSQEVNVLLLEKQRFTLEQEEAERRYMELEDKVIELERLLKRNGIASPQSATPSFSFSPATTAANSTTSISTSTSSPFVNSHNFNNNKNSPSFLAQSSPAILPPNHTLSPLASSTGIQANASTPLVPPQQRGKEKEKPPVSPTLTSCVGGSDASRLDVSVVPSPTAPVRKNRKKSIISLFSL